MNTTTRQFNRHDAAAIRKAARAYMGQRVRVEAGQRFDTTGVLTADSTRWDDDTSDLNGIHALNDLYGCDIPEGYTLDLYIYNGNPNTYGELLLNLDARWDGTAWVVWDPFSQRHNATATPTR